MRKSIVVLMVMMWFGVFPLTGAKTPKTPIKVEKAEVIELQPLLKGMAFVRIRCQVNGVLYYQGYRDPLETKKEDFFFKKAETQLKNDGITLSKNQLLEFYALLETELKDNGVRILDIQTPKESDSTVIPVIVLGMEILPVPPDQFCISVDLTATKWMSYWAGEESVQAPVIVWWQKKLATANNSELKDILKKTAQVLLEKFTTQLTYANAKTAEEIKPAAQTSSPQKDTKKTNNKSKPSTKKKSKKKK